MLTRILLALALCTGSSSRSSAPESARFAIVPDAVLDRLGDFRVGLAVDIRALDPDRLGAFVPDKFACARDLLKTARVGVITFADDDVETHVTGLVETETVACLEKLAPELGFDVQRVDSAYRLGIPGKPLALTWQADDAVVVQAGHPRRTGSPPAVIQGLLARIPRSAKAWLVSSGFPEYKISSVVGYLETSVDALTITATAESMEEGDARSWIEGIVRGVKKSAAAKGMRVEDSWFVIEATPPKAKLVATIPAAVFAAR